MTDQDGLIDYIKELDLTFSRLVYRVRVLHSRYTVDEITDTQFVVLRTLRKGPCNTSFLARMLGVTMSAVTALINRLHRMGLVERRRRQRDRRQVKISITPEGLKVLKTVEAKRYLLLALYLSQISEEERRQLLALLKKTINLFERENISGEDACRR
ncbi:MAG: MarR family transcriptional regulator [Bacillota bacterium]